MIVAFHAPMKPPDHPLPSGDRQLARHLMQALALGGFEVRLASRFRSYEGAGDGDRQRQLAAAGRRAAAALVDGYRRAPAAARPRLWFTYHLYHKAPDHLGPAVARALAIPYVVCEASSAAKQAAGPWAAGHAQAARAIGRADRVLQLNPGDAAGVEPLLAAADRQVALPPCIDADPFAAAAAARDHHRRLLADRLGLDRQRPWLVTAAMFRAGDKLASYRLLAAALQRLAGDPGAAAGRRPWTLLVAGDGPARAEVAALLAPLAGDRLRLLGQVAAAAMPGLLAAADLAVWPGVREPLGVWLIEAAAAGLPVVAGHRPGAAAIVDAGVTGLLPPAGDAVAFAGAVDRLLADPPLRRRLGEAAGRRARRHHHLAAAGRRLRHHLAPLLAPAAGEGQR